MNVLNVFLKSNGNAGHIYSLWYYRKCCWRLYLMWYRLAHQRSLLLVQMLMTSSNAVSGKLTRKLLNIRWLLYHPTISNFSSILFFGMFHMLMKMRLNLTVFTWIWQLSLQCDSCCLKVTVVAWVWQLLLECDGCHSNLSFVSLIYHVHKKSWLQLHHMP